VPLPQVHRPLAAAFALGLAAWQTGQDVKSVLELAGYSSRIAQSVVQKVEFEAEKMSAPVSSRRMPPTMAPPAPGVKKYVKDCMSRMVEKKVANLGPTGTLAAPGTSGAVSSVQILCTIIQGNGDGQRSGNVVHVDRYFLRGIVTMPTALAAIFRVIVFKDLQANGTTPVVTDVLANASYYGFYNTSTVTSVGGSRFVILKDHSFTLQSTLATSNPITPFEWEVPKCKMTVTYTGNTGTSTDVQTNNVWVLAICNDATTTYTLAGQVHYRDG